MTRMLWTQDLTNYDGRYYQLREARLNPKPIQKPYPPIVIGGSGEQRTLRVVAEHADIWNFTGDDVAVFQHKQNVLREHCDAVGRNPDEIERSVQIRADYDDLSTTVAKLQPLVDAGATHIILGLVYPYPDGIVDRLADEIVSRVS